MFNCELLLVKPAQQRFLHFLTWSTVNVFVVLHHDHREAAPRAGLDKAGYGDGIAELSETIGDQLTAIEEKIYQTRNESSQDILNYPPRLDNKILDVMSSVQSADARPTDGAIELFRDLRSELDGYLAELDGVVGEEIAQLNSLVREKSAPAVLIPE